MSQVQSHTAESHNDFDLYKLLNDRVQKEIDELYQVQTTHSNAVAALLAACGFAKENHWVLLCLGVAGAIVCLTWWGTYKGQEKWKLWWTIELAKAECRLKDVCIWRKLVFVECGDDASLMKLLNKPNDFDGPPPAMKIVDGVSRLRPLVFGILFVVVMSYAMTQIASR